MKPGPKPKERPVLICANPKCGKEFRPKRLCDPNRFCSHACSSAARMISINYHKAMPPGLGPPAKPLPALTEAERVELEDRLNEERKRLLASGRPLVDAGWRERRATSRAEV